MPWWQARGDFHLPAEHEGDSDSSQSDSAQMSDSQSDASEDEGGAMPEFEDAERKTARFTEYSISSSVVPRNDGEDQRGRGCVGGPAWEGLRGRTWWEGRRGRTSVGGPA